MGVHQILENWIFEVEFVFVEMVMPWGMTVWMVKMVWMALCGWVSSCFAVAREIAHALRNGDIGAFHVG